MASILAAFGEGGSWIWRQGLFGCVVSALVFELALHATLLGVDRLAWKIGVNGMFADVYYLAKIIM